MVDQTIALPDEELALRVSEGADTQAFASLFERHRKQVYCSCRWFFENGQSAEDATQETFLRAYKNICSFHGGDFRGWLMRIASNVCIDLWRKSRFESDIGDAELPERASSADIQTALEARLVAERVRSEIRSLPRNQRLCIEMKVEGYSIRRRRRGSASPRTP